VAKGGRGPDLHVFYNPPRSERIKKSGSATRIVNCQSARPRVARIGDGFYGFRYSAVFFLKKKKKKLDPKLGGLLTYLKTTIF
jgi:hypothetical protein